MPSPTIWGLFAVAVAAAALLSVSAAINHSIPREALKKRTPSPVYTTAAPPPYTPSLDHEQQQYLTAHNRHRRIARVPNLSWDANLAGAAHKWAEERRVDCDHRHHSSNPYGENIYWISYNEFDPIDVVDSWVEEFRWYNHTTLSCNCVPERQGCECGHYLNVIWSTTRRFGCSGSIYCDDQNGILVVCNYHPPGLAKGINPFTGLKIGAEHED